MILVKGIANIILSMVMGKLWGIMGVLVATTVTSATTLFWYEPKIVYEYFKKSIWDEVLYHITTVTLLTISFGLTYLVVHRMQGTGMIYLLYKGVICLITSNIVYAVLLGIWIIMKRKMHERRFF